VTSQQVSEFLTVAELAERLNTSERFVRRLVEERRIAFHKFGSHLRFDSHDVDAFVAAARVEVPAWRRVAS